MQFQSSCYEFVEMQLNFSSAQGWCKGTGGHLAFIKSEEVHQFLKSHITDINNRWIGLAYATYDLIPESDTKALSWLDGSALNYNNWEFAQPSTSPADCTYVHNHTGYLTWAMINCNNLLPFICEFDLQMSPANSYSVFHIIIPLEWQLNPYLGKFSCTFSTGDGKMYYVDRQDQ
ncbi:polycystic kidney disease protein 1-like 2 [Amblyraja radiata]|uniref:polycystic kidney disease protein 1-like 2 n=1 Tax=Amblyraja radiata TaxID=386614 RepID=UPI0014038902|nr:polycystic kidney disease protein 1-like 2 [Amblyraja radiata]